MRRRVEDNFTAKEQQEIDAAAEEAKQTLGQWPFSGEFDGQTMSQTTRGRRVFVTMEKGEVVKLRVEYET